MSYDVLIVDDEEDICQLIADILNDEGYKTRLANDGVSAFGQIQSRQPNLVILDIWLGEAERDGIRILEMLKASYPYVPVIMISGHATVELAVSAIKKGAYDFLEKPFQAERLILTAERAIEHARLSRENDEMRLKTGADGKILGSASAISNIRAQIIETSQSMVRVLLHGEVGTGKRTIAGEIHRKSKRAKGPFMKFDCDGVRVEQLESELFGTEITESEQTVACKIGILEQANGGTLYLSSIECLNIACQNKLNHFLKTGSFVRLGSQKNITSDVRLIVGTTLSPEVLKETLVVKDLFYRLTPVTIYAPSLKERVCDIAVLSKHFIGQIALSRGSQPKRISQETIATLQIFPWIDNLNQLRHILEWVFIHYPNTDVIAPEHLPKNFTSQENQKTLGGHSDSPIVIMPLKEAREIFEKEYLVAQLKRFGGNISKTASFIGMERSALHRKLKTLGVSVSS